MWQDFLSWLQQIDWSAFSQDLLLIGAKSLLFAALPTVVGIILFRRWRRLQGTSLSIYVLFPAGSASMMKLLHRTTVGEAFPGKVRETVRTLLGIAKRNKRNNSDRELLEFTPDEKVSIGPQLLSAVEERFAHLRLKQAVAGYDAVTEHRFNAFVRFGAPPENPRGKNEVQVLLANACTECPVSTEHLPTKLLARTCLARNDENRHMPVMIPVEA